MRHEAFLAAAALNIRDDASPWHTKYEVGRVWILPRLGGWRGELSPFLVPSCCLVSR